jgi:hypothetical protein
METLPIDLLFEILAFEPKTAGAVCCTSNVLYQRMSKRVDSFHRVLEEVYDRSYAHLNFADSLYEL